MLNFAVIKDGIVDNIIAAESLQIAEEVTGLTCINFYTPKSGDIYEDGQFIPSPSDPGEYPIIL